MAAARAPAQPGAVAAFLRANPDFLAEHADLYRVLTPPERVHGEVLADHMAAMVRAERAQCAALAERADGVLAAGRAAAGLTARVQEAVLALMRAEDPAECISGVFPAVLAVDSATLCAETLSTDSGSAGDSGRTGGVISRLPPAGARALPPGTVARLLDGRTVAYRNEVADATLLHGEAAQLARHDALVLIPIEAPTLLALSARDASALDPAQGAGAMTFLGRAIAAALAR
ncbi:MAG: DUF484 family protein [Thermomicrobiales bacterium]